MAGSGLSVQTRSWLAQAGIHTLPELKKVGAAAAFMEIKALHPGKVGVDLLWALGLCLAPGGLDAAARQALLDEVLGC